MPKRRELAVEQLHQLADDFEELWKTLTRDPVVEERKRRGWTIFAGALGAAATMVTRRALTKAWPILTGEGPPVGAPKASAQEPARPRE